MIRVLSSFPIRALELVKKHYWVFVKRKWNLGPCIISFNYSIWQKKLKSIFHFSAGTTLKNWWLLSHFQPKTENMIKDTKWKKSNLHFSFIVTSFPMVHFCCVSRLSARAMYSQGSLVANCVLKGWGGVGWGYITAVKPAVVHVCLVNSTTL